MTNYIIDNSNEKIQVGKIICLARTYEKHATEMNATTTKDPIIFLKPESSVIFNNESIVIPKMSHCVHHEVELGLVISMDGKNIPEKNAMDYVLGYVIALDITARDIQSDAKKKGHPWSIAKGFDTFAPVGPRIVPGNTIDPHHVDIWLKVNGDLKQNGNTRDMIFTVGELISYISTVMTLEPMDIIATGTPEGVGPMKDGDIIEAGIQGIGVLTVTAQKESRISSMLKGLTKKG